MPRTELQEIGREGEDRALAFLEQQGLKLVERNFLCKVGELDLVMQDGAHLVFIEVRERSTPFFGGAAASISPAKQRRILRAAKFYLLRFANMPPCRIDVVAIDGDRINWLRNAIIDQM
ncbi:YraN family protein [Pseudoduganella violaceinigra]|uniref:YraN family protein n=1 Tax=Pseudoduganella violaceinigra TaxID=246602 RepID=UPI00041D7986|nr:YraN family protein [Pseudoduganella violaceinigra]